MPHRYRVELVRNHPDAFRHKEIIEIEKTFDAYRDAYQYADKLGRCPLNTKNSRLPAPVNTVAWRCVDPRFACVRIVIEPATMRDQ